MTQPKITFDQLDTGTGDNQVMTFSQYAQLGRPVRAVHGILAGSTGTSVIPYDNTVPLVSEGTQFGSAPYTMMDANNHIHIVFSVNVDVSANNTTVIIAVFRDSTCIAASPVTISTAGRPQVMTLTITDEPADVAAHTYSGRVGVGAAGPSWYINSTNSGNNLGGTITSSFILSEHGPLV